MDKLLAMSILSAGPDDSVGNWWLSQLSAAAGDLSKKKKEAKNEKENRSGIGNDSNVRYSIGKENKPRFAMEFDGLNCFENIVSQ